jgi:hypothetical protein
VTPVATAGRLSAWGLTESDAFTNALSTLGPVPAPRDRWWRNGLHRVLAASTDTFGKEAARLARIARKHHVNPSTLTQYLIVLAGFSDDTGTDPVFARRDTIATRMGRSERHVGRCRAAAIEAGWERTVRRRFTSADGSWKSLSNLSRPLLPSKIEAQLRADANRSRRDGARGRRATPPPPVEPSRPLPSVFEPDPPTPDVDPAEALATARRLLASKGRAREPD